MLEVRSYRGDAVNGKTRHQVTLGTERTLEAKIR